MRFDGINDFLFFVARNMALTSQGVHFRSL